MKYTFPKHIHISKQVFISRYVPVDVCTYLKLKIIFEILPKKVTISDCISFRPRNIMIGL